METFSALLAICAENSPIPGEFPAQRPVSRGFDVFFIYVWINGWVNNREAGNLRCHRGHYVVIVMSLITLINNLNDRCYMFLSDYIFVKLFWGIWFLILRRSFKHHMRLFFSVSIGRVSNGIGLCLGLKSWKRIRIRQGHTSTKGCIITHVWCWARCWGIGIDTCSIEAGFFIWNLWIFLINWNGKTEFKQNKPLIVECSRYAIFMHRQLVYIYI